MAGHGTRSTALALVFAAAVSYPVALAGADGFGGGPPDEGYRADDFTHTYCRTTTLNADLIANVDGRMSNLDVQTTFVDVFSTVCGSAPAGQTVDLAFYGGDLPGTVRGEHLCTVFVPSSNPPKCDDARITLDLIQINIGSNDDHDQSKTACHEIGHSVGLRHSGLTDCMRSGESPSPPVAANITYDGHHVSHANSQN